MWSAQARNVFVLLFCWAIVISSGVLPTGTAAAQPVVPSLYVGLGTGTNLGGTVGSGLEIRVGRHLSTNAAVGVWPEILGERGGAFDFDVGVKVYPVSRWLFTGLNYGIIHAEVVTHSADEIPLLRKRRGITFSLGVRTPAFHRFYASGFAGVTSDGEANHFTVFDRRTFMPHMGLIFGYEFSASR